jgi:hypothetical protein
MSYWNGTGKEQEKYNEMLKADWEFTLKTHMVFNSYYRYYNDGDLPGWAKARYDLTEYGYAGRRVLNDKGIQVQEDRVTSVILDEYKRFKKAA